MVRTAVFVTAVVALAIDAGAQTQDLNQYLNSTVLRMEAAAVAQAEAGSRDAAAIRNLLPHRVSQSFVSFVQTKQSRSLLDVVDKLRLNKMLTGAPGSGGTSLVSRVAVPAVLGAAIEYGGILQRTTGPVTTLRANALGVGRLLLGSEQFPYCPELDTNGCGYSARLLRALSATISLEDTRKQVPGTAVGVPTVASLASNDFRTASWGVRIDLTPSNHLDDPKYIRAWGTAINKLQKAPAAAGLTKAIVDFFDPALEKEVYTTWMADTVALLNKAPGEADFYLALEEQLTLLIPRLAETDPQFSTNLAAVVRSYADYFDVRDALIREAQVHKLSVEFTNLVPLNAPGTLNTRLVYSHQPTSAPTVVTANVSTTWYANKQTSVERWRDLQIAGQLDRRLSEIPRFGHAVATLGVYYQWMKEDALIKLPAGTVAPGTSIVLPAEASSLLDTKGHIVVVQGQLSVPMGDVIKLPFSVTWANRSELIKEKDVRGQVGMTLDIDGLFR